MLAGAPFTNVNGRARGCDRATHLLFSDEDSDDRVQTGAEAHARRPLNAQLVDDPLTPLRRAEDLDLGPDEADGVRLGDGVLHVPALLRAL